MRFENLDHSARKAVWNNFLKPIGSHFPEECCERLAEEDFNGRQIKNVVKMARLLAKKDQKSLEESHLWEVISVVRDDIQYRRTA